MIGDLNYHYVEKLKANSKVLRCERNMRVVISDHPHHSRDRNLTVPMPASGVINKAISVLDTVQYGGQKGIRTAL